MCLGQRCAHSPSLFLSLSLCWAGISYDCPEVSAQGQRRGEITCRHRKRTVPATCRKPGFVFLLSHCLSSHLPRLSSLHSPRPLSPFYSFPAFLFHHLLHLLFFPLAVSALGTGHDLRGPSVCSQATMYLEAGAKNNTSIFLQVIFPPCKQLRILWITDFEEY